MKENKSMRDNFTKKTLDILAKRVGGLCSNPNCKSSTTGPRSETTKIVNIGEGAHITGATSKGKRFDKSLSREQRKSPDNGIWLCGSCAKLIDNDPTRYTDGILKQWKQHAEDAALRKVEGSTVSHANMIDNKISYKKRRQESNSPEIVGKTTSISLPLSAWTRFHEIDIKYDALFKKLSLLMRNGEYEQAIDCYWKILYFTGTRERWDDRTILSNKLLALSRKEKDYKTTGLILAKGQAWPLIYTGDYDLAEVILEDALKCFKKDNEYSKAGIYYEYMADIFDQKGRLDLALVCYKEARKRYNKDIDEELVELKRKFVITKYEDKKSGSRIVALEFLIEKFSKIKNYKEALAEIELSKSLYMLKDNDEALNRAQHAYHLLNDKIIMPRNAIKAKEVLCTIMEGKQIVEA